MYLLFKGTPSNSDSLKYTDDIINWASTKYHISSVKDSIKDSISVLFFIKKCLHHHNQWP